MTQKQTVAPAPSGIWPLPRPAPQRRAAPAEPPPAAPSALLARAAGDGMRSWSAQSAEGRPARSRKPARVELPSADAGRRVSYKMTVRNAHLDALIDCRVEHELPDGVELLAAEPAGVFVDGRLRWSLGTLPRGREATLCVTVRRLDETMPLPPAADFFVEYARHGRQVRPRLSLCVEAPAAAEEGERVPFWVSVHNTGSGPASAVVLRGRFVGEAGQEAAVPLLLPDQRHSVRLFGTCDDDGLTLQAMAHSAEGCTVAVEAAVTASRPDLRLSLGGPAEATAGVPARFEIDAANAGAGTASPVTVVATLPAGMRLTSASPPADYDAEYREVKWELARLTPDGFGRVTFEAAFDEGVGPTTLTAHARWRDVAARAEANVRAVSPRLTLAAPAAEAVAGRHFDWAFTLTNAGDATASGVVAVCELPEGVGFVASPEGHVFDRRIEWHLGDVARGESRELSARLSAELPGTAGLRLAALDAAGRAAEAEAALVVAIDPKDRSDLLARLMAETDAPAAPGRAAPALAVEGERYLLFSLAGVDYAVPAEQILEVGRPPLVTPVPNVPDWLHGLTNVRGDIVSVVDLRAFLDLERGGPSAEGRMLLARAEDLTTGLLVDRVRGIRRFRPEAFRPAASIAEGRVAPFVRGVCSDGGGLLVGLDLGAMLLGPDFRAFESA